MNRYLPCLSLDNIKLYCDVNTELIEHRLMVPFDIKRSDFFLIGSFEYPDIYGPFWIATSLIFILSFGSNLDNLIEY